MASEKVSAHDVDVVDDDSSDDEKGTRAARVNTGSSFALKFKKFIASKTMGTKAGRVIVISLMGDEGDNILQALKDAATKFKDKNTAKDLKKDFLTVVIKAKLLADDGRITQASTSHAREPVNNFAIQLMDLLNQEPGKIEVDDVVVSFNKIRDLTAAILEKHVQHKNVDKVVQLFNFYGDPEFLGDVLNNEKYAVERAVIKTNLGVIVEDLKARLDQEKQKPRSCSIQLCPDFALPPKGVFAGSLYCARHHMEHVQGDLGQPKLHQYLNPATRSSGAFVSFLKAQSQAMPLEEKKDDASETPGVAGQLWLVTKHDKLVELFRFYDAIVQYKRLRRNLRNQRVELIVRKFVKNNIMGIKPETQAQIKADAGNPQKHRTIFDAAQKEALAILEAQFAQFLESKDFANYKASQTMPEEAAAAAAKKA